MVDAAVDVDGFFLPDVLNCRNFDLPSKYIGEVIAEICKLVGVRLRDQVLSGYSTAETQAK